MSELIVSLIAIFLAVLALAILFVIPVISERSLDKAIEENKREQEEWMGRQKKKPGYKEPPDPPDVPPPSLNLY